MPRKSASSATDSQNQLIEQFQSLVADTEKLLQESADLAGDQAEGLREQLRNSLGKARDALKGTEESLKERGKAAIDATEGYVQSNPWQTIGIAAAIGVLIGLLIGRR
ncbi:YqjD family protein [Ectopseudomonas mendocina]|uniref:YqjD family protein n=1 Tax=Ectopseudomonas mendocina TaxID=300 RepID=A0ABZ2RMM7_ECTME